MPQDTDSFKEIMNKLPSNVHLTFAKQINSVVEDLGGLPIPERISVGIGFSEKGYGFGEITIVEDKEGQIYIDTECTDRELCQLVDNAITDTDQDPDRHAKYCKAMNQRCGEGNFCGGNHE